MYIILTVSALQKVKSFTKLLKNKPQNTWLLSSYTVISRSNKLQSERCSALRAACSASKQSRVAYVRSGR